MMRKLPLIRSKTVLKTILTSCGGKYILGKAYLDNTEGERRGRGVTIDACTARLTLARVEIRGGGREGGEGAGYMQGKVYLGRKGGGGGGRVQDKCRARVYLGTGAGRLGAWGPGTRRARLGQGGKGVRPRYMQVNYFQRIMPGLFHLHSDGTDNAMFCQPAGTMQSQRQSP